MLTIWLAPKKEAILQPTHIPTAIGIVCRPEHRFTVTQLQRRNIQQILRNWLQIKYPYKHRLRLLSLTTTLLLTSTPVKSDAVDDCFGGYDPADIVTGCTQLLGSAWVTDDQIPLVFNNRGNAYGLLRLNQKAIEDYSRAIALEPNYIEARYNRATTYLEMNDLELAITDFTDLLKAAPGRIGAYNNRGLAFLRAGNLNAAIFDFTNALEIDANYPFAYNNRGVAWRRKGELDRALSDFTAAIRLHDKYVGPLNSRGEVYVEIGDASRARIDFKAALILDPDHATALRNLQRLNEAESGQAIDPLYGSAWAK
jgi:tetratricopeptide (TPR) repeat protein